jgi:hypothetical protein
VISSLGSQMTFLALPWFVLAEGFARFGFARANPRLRD